MAGGVTNGGEFLAELQADQHVRLQGLDLEAFQHATLALDQAGGVDHHELAPGRLDHEARAQHQGQEVGDGVDVPNEIERIAACLGERRGYVELGERDRRRRTHVLLPDVRIDEGRRAPRAQQGIHQEVAIAALAAIGGADDQDVTPIFRQDARGGMLLGCRNVRRSLRHVCGYRP